MKNKKLFTRILENTFYLMARVSKFYIVQLVFTAMTVVCIKRVLSVDMPLKITILFEKVIHTGLLNMVQFGTILVLFYHIVMVIFKTGLTKFKTIAEVFDYNMNLIVLNFTLTLLHALHLTSITALPNSTIVTLILVVMILVDAIRKNRAHPKETVIIGGTRNGKTAHFNGLSGTKCAPAPLLNKDNSDSFTELNKDVVGLLEVLPIEDRTYINECKKYILSYLGDMSNYFKNLNERLLTMALLANIQLYGRNDKRIWHHLDDILNKSKTITELSNLPQNEVTQALVKFFLDYYSFLNKTEQPKSKIYEQTLVIRTVISNFKESCDYQTNQTKRKPSKSHYYRRSNLNR